MSERLSIGVVGGGLIAQVEHIPNLLALPDRFILRGVAEPSRIVRDALGQRFGIETFADAADLLGLGLDALLIAAPDPWHADLAGRAMEAGLHVFCEKPLCYGLDELDALARIQERSGVVLQVGYMKRFDPSVEAAERLLSGKSDRLRLVSVEVNDPDAWPFVAHRTVTTGSDVPQAILDETAARRRGQVVAALGFEPNATLFRGFAGAYCSALIHDVNLVHGLLDSIGAVPGRVLGAAIFADGAGGHASVEVNAGQALWTMTHVEVPKVADYAERVTFYFDDETIELVFPAPYLNHQPTQLIHKRSTGHRLETAAIRAGYEEPFVSELGWFSSTIVEGTPARNTVAEARRDQALLISMAIRAAASW